MSRLTQGAKDLKRYLYLSDLPAVCSASVLHEFTWTYIVLCLVYISLTSQNSVCALHHVLAETCGKSTDLGSIIQLLFQLKLKGLLGLNVTNPPPPPPPTTYH